MYLTNACSWSDELFGTPRKISPVKISRKVPYHQSPKQLDIRDGVGLRARGAPSKGHSSYHTQRASSTRRQGSFPNPSSHPTLLTMSTIAHAASAINVCHAKSTFFGTSKALKAAPVRVHRRVALAARADAAVWASMSGFMKNKCKEAAALEAKDKEAGRAAWIELDKQGNWIYFNRPPNVPAA